MGPLPFIILGACLEVLKWLLWVTAGLLLVLILAQWLRGEEGRPLATFVAALAFGAGGLACGFGAAAIRRRLHGS